MYVASVLNLLNLLNVITNITFYLVSYAFNADASL